VWFSNYVIVFKVLGPWFNWNGWGIFHFCVFETIILLVEGSHFRAMLTSPGVTQRNSASPKDAEPDTADPLWWTKPPRRFCKKCKALKPPRAHHCSVAGHCVMKMDHYCPWVNNTVGQNNHKFFLQFLVYVTIGTLYAALLTMSYAFSAWRGAVPWPAWGVGEMAMAIAQVVLDIFFTIFVIAMMCDQYEAICTDTTGIEAMKRWEERDWTIVQGLTSIMGTPLGVHWFVPTLPQGTAFYEWSPRDDPDAYDIRDPSIKTFFRDLELQHRLADLKSAEMLGDGEAEGGEGAPLKDAQSTLTKRKGGSGAMSNAAQDAKLVRVYDRQGRPLLVPPKIAAEMEAAALEGDAATGKSGEGAARHVSMGS